MRPTVLLLFALAVMSLACASGNTEGDESEECSDNADQDRDGLFDCNDPDCSGAAICGGGDRDPDADTDTDVDSGGTSDDTGNDDVGGGGPATFEDFVNVSTVYVGDAACYDGVAWNTQTAGAGCTSDIAISGTVSDFQTDENVEGASVDFWSNDDINTASSLSIETDSNGDGVATLPSCTPIGYMTSTPPEWQDTVNTYEVHQVYEWDASGATSDTWNSVSVATSKLIPSLLGLEWTPGTSLIAGTAYDCGGEPIQHAQVYIHDADGNIPADISIRYFDNSLPNSDQPDTNDDGLWSAVNIQPGEWTVEMWVYNGSELQLLGATNLTIVPDSVVISNIYTGIEDGVYLPASCVETCE